MTKTYDLKNFNSEEFLSNNWQKKPLILRQALPESVYHADKDEIAGLACEPEAESRLIFNSEEDRKISAEDGPFEEDKFDSLPETNWSLMVQKCDQWMDNVFEIRKYFAFLPHWRFDDIMASYGSDQSSSGPHIDNYDVFILQSEGKKTWRIEKLPRPLITLPDSEFVEDLDLRILKDFKEYDEYVLEPGDLLYIPVGYAHWGISRGESLSFSIGLRSPSLKEIAKNYFYNMIEKIDDDLFFKEEVAYDPKFPGLIPDDVAKDIKKDWPNFLPDLPKDINKRFAEIVTSAGSEVVNPNETEIDNIEVSELFHKQCVNKSPESKFAYIKGEKLKLYADGNCYELDKKYLWLVEHLCNELELDCLKITKQLSEGPVIELLKKLISTSSLVTAE